MLHIHTLVEGARRLYLLGLCFSAEPKRASQTGSDRLVRPTMVQRVTLYVEFMAGYTGVMIGMTAAESRCELGSYTGRVMLGSFCWGSRCRALGHSHLLMSCIHSHTHTHTHICAV